MFKANGSHVLLFLPAESQLFKLVPAYLGRTMPSRTVITMPRAMFSLLMELTVFSDHTLRLTQPRVYSKPRNRDSLDYDGNHQLSAWQSQLVTLNLCPTLCPTFGMGSSRSSLRCLAQHLPFTARRVNISKSVPVTRK